MHSKKKKTVLKKLYTYVYVPTPHLEKERKNKTGKNIIQQSQTDEVTISITFTLYLAEYVFIHQPFFPVHSESTFFFIFSVYVSSSITRISSMISNHCLQFKVRSLSQFLIIVFLHATRRILHKNRSLLNTMPLIFPISKNKEVWGILYPSTSNIITCTSSQKDWIFSQLQKICAWSASNGPRGLQQTCWLETCLLLILGVIKKRIRHFQENSLQICELVVLYVPFSSLSPPRLIYSPVWFVCRTKWQIRHCDWSDQTPS